MYIQRNGTLYNRIYSYCCQLLPIQTINVDDKNRKIYEPSLVYNLHYSFGSSENARRIIYIARHQRMTKNSVYMNKYTNLIHLVTPILAPI